MGIEQLDHTADVLIRVSGDTLDDLFEEAARAMVQVIFPAHPADRHDRRETAGRLHTITTESDDIDSLLHDYLSELLFITDAESVVFSGFSVKVSDTSLECTAQGEPFDPEKHGGGMEIKGISYSGLHIIKKHDAYVVDILFDV